MLDHSSERFGLEPSSSIADLISAKMSIERVDDTKGYTSDNIVLLETQLSCK